MGVLLLDLLADTRRHQIPIQKIVLHDLPQEFLADEIDHGGILDRRGLAVDACLSVHLGKIEPIGDAAETDPAQQIQRKAGREDVVHRMEDGQAGGTRIGGDHPPGHPVVAVDDQPPLAPRPHRFDDVVDDLPLEFHGRQDGVARIGAHVVGEDRGADQVDLVGIDLVAHLPPLKFVHLRLALKPLLQIEERQMDIQAPLGEPLAEGGNDLPLPPALAGDEPGKRAHVLGQPSRLRRDDQDGRRLLLFEDLETPDDRFEIVDLAGEDMRRPGDGVLVGVEVGMDRMILADPLVEKIDMVGGGQVAPLGQIFTPRPPAPPFPSVRCPGRAHTAWGCPASRRCSCRRPPRRMWPARGC